MSRVKAGAAYVELMVKDSGLRKGLDKASERLSAFGSAARTVGATMIGFGGIAAAAFIKPVQAAASLEESLQKFGVLFGDRTADVRKWGDEFAAQIGRSQKQIIDFMGDTQSLLVPIGFEAGAAEAMSKQITQLAIDLASFNDMDDDAAMTDLHAALTGSGEVMKKYGVIVSEAAVKARMLADGLDPKSATEQQKTMARLNIILEGTAAAHGNATRSAGSFTNQLKSLYAAIDDTSAAIGGALLPVLTPLVTAMAKAAAFAGMWIQENAQIVRVAAGVIGAVAAIGAVILAVGVAASVASFMFRGLATMVSVVGTAFSVVSSVVAAILSPVGLLVAGVAALAGYLIYASGAGSQMFALFKDSFGNIAAEAKEAFGVIGAALASGDMAAAAKVFWAFLHLQWVRGVAILKQVWATLSNYLRSTAAGAVTAIASAFFVGVESIANGWSAAIDFLADSWSVFAAGVKNIWNSTVGFLKKAWVKLKAMFDDGIDVDAEVRRIDGDTAADNAAVDNSRNEAIMQREQRRKAAAAERAKKRAEAVAILDEMAAGDQSTRDAGTDAAIEAAAAEAKQAEQEYRATLDTTQADLDKAKAEEPPRETKPPGLDPIEIPEVNLGTSETPAPGELTLDPHSADVIEGFGDDVGPELSGITSGFDSLGMGFGNEAAVFDSPEPITTFETPLQESSRDLTAADMDAVEADLLGLEPTVIDAAAEVQAAVATSPQTSRDLAPKMDAIKAGAIVADAAIAEPVAGKVADTDGGMSLPAEVRRAIIDNDRKMGELLALARSRRMVFG